MDDLPFTISLADEITVLNKKVKLLQLAEGGFRTSLDSVMLAAACPARPGEKVVDMGCGVGGATFCLLFRVPFLSVVGVEREKTYFDLALRNKLLNKLDPDTCLDVSFMHADIRDYNPLDQQVYDHVIVNPPYYEVGHHTPSPDKVKAQALGHQDDNMSLEDWILSGHRLLRSGGSFTIIYPTSGADRIICALGKKFGAVEIIPLWPRKGEDSKRVIIRARKGRKSPCVLRSGLTLHQDDGRYTFEADLILRDGGSL